MAKKESQKTTVTIRGEEVEPAEFISEFHLMPMMELIGDTEIPNPDSAEYPTYMRGMMTRFANPINQYRLAYSLTQIFPDIPIHIARYGVSSDDEVKAYLGITTVDFINIMDALVPHLARLNSAVEAEYKKRGMDRDKGFGGKTKAAA